MRFVVIFTLFIFLSATVEGQIDPSSAMLLNSGQTSVRDGGLDSGRYTVKPRADASPARVVRKAESKTRSATSPEASSLTQTPAVPPTATLSAPPFAPNPVPVTLQVPAPTPTQVADEEDSDENEPAFPPQVTPQVPRDQRRLTMLELSFAPGYLSSDSQSTFAPRNYVSNAPTMSIEAGVWTSAHFGVHASFNGTINANLADSFNNTRNAPLSEQWFSAGVRSRNFFGDGPLAPLLQFGLDYREFNFRVPSDTLFRDKFSTSGLILLLDGEIPMSQSSALTFGGEFGPKLSHYETANAEQTKSGDEPQTTTVGIHVGTRFRFDEAQSVFWKISYGVERNLFSGSTSINDPLTGLPQTNVSVTQTFTLFQLGYAWAN